MANAGVSAGIANHLTFGACEDVDVRRDGGRIIERPAADEAHVGMAVLAEDGHLAVAAAKDPLNAAVVAREVEGLRRACEERDALTFDDEVDHERAAGLALTVQAVAAMNEHRVRFEPVAKCSARAPA